MKNLLYLFIIFIIVSCSKDDSSISSNGAPSDFEVTIFSDSYLNVNINWSQSFDPEDEIVKYIVYLEDTEVVNNLTNRDYNFLNLEPLTNYMGSVVAFDPNGNKTTADFTFTTTGNLAPSDFNTTSIVPSNISVGVEWTESIDPENEDVVYDLYIDNILITSDLSQTYYLIENLDVDTSYQIKIVAKDESSNSIELTFETQTLNGIYEGDVNLNSQEGIDNFGKQGYVEITGNFEMSGFVGTSNINNLSELGSIKKVRGYFDINFIDELTSLSGLKIEHVGKSFRIRDNRNLLNLSGLEGLVEVLGSFEIELNTNLADISGINSLTTVGNALSIDNNINLKDIIGFNNLDSVESIYINANWSLIGIKGFIKVVKLNRDLAIQDNTSLSSLTGFDMLSEIDRLFVKNTLIPNLDALSSLAIVNSEISLDNNDQLENIRGLSSLNKITYGSLNIYRNDILATLDGLENLSEIGATVEFGNNPKLTNFCALQNLMQNFTPSALPQINNNGFNPTLTDIANGNCSI